MRIRALIASVVCGVVLVPAIGSAQALTSLASVRVGYTTRKNTVKPQGELKAQIDALDAQIAEAARLGKNGELRRLFAKGMALLNGRPWTDALEFSNSLVLRTNGVVVDSSKPYLVRLEQIYTPSISLEHALTAKVGIYKRPSGPPGAAGAPPPAPVLVKELGTFEGVGRDLRESPFPFELDLREIADGSYVLVANVTDRETALGAVNLPVSLHKGLDDLVARLQNEATHAPENLRAEILFPVDRMKNVNRGRLELRTFDPEKELGTAEAVVTAVKAKKDPFAGRTGDIKRHYALESADEILPYRMFVPKAYTGAKAFPLIVALHGLGGTEDSFFDGYTSALPPLAESHGYIVAAPLGYRVDGFYGWGLGNPPANPTTKRTQELSEQDVMQVLQHVRHLYKIDDNRIYLMGHSMGAIGTWKVAPKYPDLWAAIAPISGNGAPATLERIRSVPEIVVHGDADPTVPVSGSRTMVAKLKEMGTEVKYIEVPGGLHSDVVAPNLAAVIEFFDTHRKTARGTSAGGTR
jgi:poly(3-hydroxybutyrate) depolymerase